MSAGGQRTKPPARKSFCAALSLPIFKEDFFWMCCVQVHTTKTTNGRIGNQFLGSSPLYQACCLNRQRSSRRSTQNGEVRVGVMYSSILGGRCAACAAIPHGRDTKVRQRNTFTKCGLARSLAQSVSHQNGRSALALLGL